jgi:hypothetical protein
MKYAQGAGHRVQKPPEFSPPAKGECPKGEGVVFGVTLSKFLFPL